MLLKNKVGDKCFMRTATKLRDFNGRVKCLWRDPDSVNGFAGAVSLHSHTAHSRESFDFIPRVMAKAPPMYAVLQRIDRNKQRHGERPVAYDKAFWRPPLRSQAAHELEESQIRALG